MTEKKHLLTTREVGEILRVNHRTIAKWADAGHLPTLKTVGGHRRFRRDALAATIKSWEVRQ